VSCFLVLTNATLTLLGGTRLTPPGWIDGLVQNGAPDGLLIVDTSSNTVIDRLVCEGGDRQRERHRVSDDGFAGRDDAERRRRVGRTCRSGGLSEASRW
jgi:hypothetical protein